MCSVGIVVVRDGVITEKIHELIKPTPHYYLDWMTDIHGLTAEDTATAETFPAVWVRIAPRIAGLPLVAHNSPFDESYLRQAHEAYEMEYPDYQFHCTLRMACAAFPELPDHHLPTVAARVGFSLENHHHALADAEACAQIAITLN